jgi:tRNA-specific 2-thiouridylase
VDENKDQSYFLHRLNQEQLGMTLFPVGHLRKPEVRKQAAKFGLPTAEKKDSQGICFIGKVDLVDFLKSRIAGRVGPIVTVEGEVVGKHDGLAPYTIGQRHGMNLGGGAPYFVVEKDAVRNTLVVARGNDHPALFSSSLIAEDAHWIAGAAPTMPFSCAARIRYRQPLQSVNVSRENGRVRVAFDESQRAISPGQFVVFYDGEACLGGAVISGRE